MSKYDKDTKFYWLQLKEDFFEDDAINWLEEQQPNGRDYAYFYLKLCLKSLKSNGILIRNVGNILIPYDNKKLAELTKMDFDTVCIAMELLKKIGLIQILKNGEIYMTQLQNLIGSKSLGALKKQQQRMISGQQADKCPPKIEIENRDRDKDIIKRVFKKPTIEEIKNYIVEKNLNVDANTFYDYFNENNWVDSKGNKVKSWKQKLITWGNYKKEKSKEIIPEWYHKEYKKEEGMTDEEVELAIRELEKQK